MCGVGNGSFGSEWAGARLGTGLARVLDTAQISALTFCLPVDLRQSERQATPRLHHDSDDSCNPQGLSVYDYNDKAVWTLNWDYSLTARVGAYMISSAADFPWQKSLLKLLQTWVARKLTMCGRKTQRTSRRSLTSWRSWDRKYSYMSHKTPFSPC